MLIEQLQLNVTHLQKLNSNQESKIKQLENTIKQKSYKIPYNTTSQNDEHESEENIGNSMFETIINIGLSYISSGLLNSNHFKGKAIDYGLGVILGKKNRKTLYKFGNYFGYNPYNIVKHINMTSLTESLKDNSEYVYKKSADFMFSTAEYASIGFEAAKDTVEASSEFLKQKCSELDENYDVINKSKEYLSNYGEFIGSTSQKAYDHVSQFTKDSKFYLYKTLKENEDKIDQAKIIVDQVGETTKEYFNHTYI